MLTLAVRKSPRPGKYITYGRKICFAGSNFLIRNTKWRYAPHRITFQREPFSSPLRFSAVADLIAWCDLAARLPVGCSSKDRTQPLTFRIRGRKLPSRKREYRLPRSRLSAGAGQNASDRGAIGLAIFPLDWYFLHIFSM